ncbi:hypothetical protein SAMN05443575_0689 [Jatrophihabitans endophyticus]|uniref:DUF2255 family protein n=1 Tax=Jatrophihabitans endophyticus TaxID=1206085 RepID=A0A1M5DT54_9ACTN|nr:DUF2255 family protein [Jatrophihabitans endophyticus]SHF70208.1 hypothetical protein SAMN05443575_0689 [Jatrophihabitans endophyticus]
MAWSTEELARLARAEELHLAALRADGTLARPLPVWVVQIDRTAYVRTWHRRDTGWFGHVLRSGRAHVRVPGVERDAIVTDVGRDDGGLRARIDAAYRVKYGQYGAATVDRMTGDEAAAATLRLDASS